MYRFARFFSAVLLLNLNMPLTAAQRGPSGATTVADLATTPQSGVTPKLLPGTRPNVFTTIQGNALSSSNGPLTNTLLRLRDARFGRIVTTVLSDNSGLFAFRHLDPGSYIVELMAPDEVAILAASQIVNVNAGDVASAVVRLPLRVPPFMGLLGSTLPSAAAVMGQAVAAGVVPAVATEPVSPDR
jgi:hypothetical protein